MNAPVRAPRIEHDRFAALLAAVWTKRPGVMGTDWLDGEMAERVRSIAAQWSLTGLEETEGT